MTPNILNTLLGLALVYCAILAPGPLHASIWLLGVAGVVIVALGLWARDGDRLKWFSGVSIVLGIALALLAMAGSMVVVPTVVLFWWVFWVGIVVAVMALWSLLYAKQRLTA